MTKRVHFYCEPGSMEHYFYFEKADTATQLEALYSLRYQVYCEERGFIPKEMCPDRMESDQYDDKSLHFGAYLNGGQVAGTVRLVKEDLIQQLPLFVKCDINESDLPGDISGANSAEISRLAVSKEVRRRKGDGDLGVNVQAMRPMGRNGKRRICPELILGLYKSMYHETKRRGIKYWLAAMEPSLAKLLSRFHFQFQEIGPEIDYYGIVKPYLANVEDIEWAVYSHDPQLFASFAEGLEPQYIPNLTSQ